MDNLLAWVSQNSGVWVPVLLTTIAAIFLRYLDKWITSSRARDIARVRDKNDVLEESKRVSTWNENLRKELRTEVENLKAEIVRIEKELDNWKDKYYSLLEEFVTLKSVADTFLEAINGDGDDTGPVR